jgi:hypothetical protein
MPLPRQIRKQVTEADRILAELNAKPGESPQPPAEPATQPATEPTPVVENVVPSEPSVTPEPANTPAPVTPVTEDWEQKYRVLQGKYDKETALARTENIRLNERISVLEQLLANMSTKPAAPTVNPDDTRSGKKYIKKEDLDEYGQDMVDFVQRAAREAAEPELDRLRRENKELEEKVGRNLGESARERMMLQLKNDVPDWEAVNVSEKFLAWLEEVDIFSGLKRRDALTKAYNNNDAARVVGIFKAFKREDSATDPAPIPSARTPAVDKGTLVAPGTPKSSTAAAPGDNKRVWKQAEIAEFYELKRRGRIPAADAQAIERDIAVATKEGRVML